MQDFIYSIIIPTYNRAESLRRALSSLKKIERSGVGGVEVVVVDNNSTDHTHGVVDEMNDASDLPIVYVLESTQGSNYARNRGIDKAIGSILIFTDDDVEFDTGWLMGIHASFHAFPDAECVTGKVIPVFEGATPGWMTPGLLCFYGAQDFINTTEMRFPDFPVEMNMALPREAVERYGRFQTSFNRNAKNLMSNDGKIFFWRLSNNGGRVVYNPNALLYHLIPRERASSEWLLRRAYWQGVSDVAFEQATSPRGRWALVVDALAAIRQLVPEVRGGYWEPRHIYWHYQRIPLPKAVNLKYRIGRIVRQFHHAMRFGD